MTLSDLMTALSAILQTNVGCTFVMGFPAWGRTQREVSGLPIGAMQLAGLNLGPRRQGGHNDLRIASWNVWLFAKDEMALVDLLDNFRSWVREGGFVVNDCRVTVSVATVERHIPDLAAQQEQHGFALTITTEW